MNITLFLLKKVFAPPNFFTFLFTVFSFKITVLINNKFIVFYLQKLCYSIHIISYYIFKLQMLFQKLYILFLRSSYSITF